MGYIIGARLKGKGKRKRGFEGVGHLNPRILESFIRQKTGIIQNLFTAFRILLFFYFSLEPCAFRLEPFSYAPYFKPLGISHGYQ